MNSQEGWGGQHRFSTACIDWRGDFGTLLDLNLNNGQVTTILDNLQLLNDSLRQAEKVSCISDAYTSQSLHLCLSVVDLQISTKITWHC